MLRIQNTLTLTHLNRSGAADILLRDEPDDEEDDEEKHDRNEENDDPGEGYSE